MEAVGTDVLGSNGVCRIGFEPKLGCAARALHRSGPTGEDRMKVFLVVLVVLALPQVLGLSNLCNAGPNTGCASKSDGTCLIENLPCGAWSQQTHCTTTVNGVPISPVSAAKKPAPQGTICQCM